MNSLAYRRRLLGAASVAVAIVFLDRVTKIWAEERLPGDPITVINGLLSFEFAENTGASFGMLRGAGPFLGLAAMVAVVVVALALKSVVRRFEVVALGLIAGGAVGNLVDRFIRGEGLLDGSVVDWIRLPNFPNFNVADSAITIGAVVLVAVALFSRE
ncbi:MAG: signal peptidase II [Acidimicrobiia bacterium]|nr:signal peptidase II [Acidimicrobiia bacterium]